MHAHWHFSRGKGLSLTGQDILLKNVCTHRDIHGQSQDFLKLVMGVGGGGVFQKNNNSMVLHALGNICMTTHNISHYY